MPYSKQTPVFKALNKFFYYYLHKRDISKTLALLADDVYSLGTGEGEIACNKEDFKKLMQEEINSLPMSIDYKIIDYKEKRRDENIWDCICNMETAVKMNNGKILIYTTRLTASFTKKGTEYLACTLHMSEASSHQDENEFFPLRYAADNMDRLDKKYQSELLKIIQQIMPGGIIGGYLEKDFPLYIVNDNFLQMLGYPTYEDFVEDIDGKIKNIIHPDDLPSVIKKINKSFATGVQYEVEYRIKKRDGSYLWVYDVGRKINTHEGKNVIISVVIDTSEKVAVRKKLEEEAKKDILTGLYNRNGGENLIVRALHKNQSYIFIIMDIDNFKNINDIYGHHEGDVMLKYVADLMISFFRSTDIILRLGGDEFVLFACPCNNSFIIEEKLKMINDIYIRKVQREYPLSKSSLSFGGIKGSDTTSFLSLYKKADRILYDVKKHGKSNFKIEDYSV